MDKKNFALVFAFLIAFAFGLRLFLIDFRPVHHDEGVNGHFVEQVLAGTWKYNPENFHGPLPFYLMALAAMAFGENIFALRLMPAIFGVLMAFAVLPLKKHLGKKGFLLACFFVLFSPALFYYSLDAIHEIFFAFFAFASLSFLLAFAVHGKKIHLYSGTACLAFLFTVKEGAFLIGPAIVLIALIVFLAKRKEKLLDGIKLGKIGIRLIVCIVMFIAIFNLLFSSFFSNPQGITDAFYAPFHWTGTMTGETGHEKHAFYYLELLIFSEILLVCFAFLGTLVAVKKREIVMLGIALFALLFLFGASVPEYKVPWGILTVIPMLAVLSGYFLENLVRKYRNVLVAGLIAMALSFIFWQAIWLSTVKCESSENKLEYVQTTFEAKEIVERIESLGKQRNLDIAIISLQNTWPLSWQLKRFNVSFFGEADFDVSHYDVVIADQTFRHRLHGTELFEIEGFALRRSVNMDAYFRRR